MSWNLSILVGQLHIMKEWEHPHFEVVRAVKIHVAGRQTPTCWRLKQQNEEHNDSTLFNTSTFKLFYFILQRIYTLT